MIYDLTPEQIEKNKARNRNVMLFASLIVIGILVVFSLSTLPEWKEKLPQLLVLWTVVFGLSALGMWSGLGNAKKKKATQVETKRKSFVLISALNQEEIPGDAIRQLVIHSGASGEVEWIFLKTSLKPFAHLRGYYNMAALASELEKMVTDPSRIVRSQGTNDPKKKAKSMLMLMGIIGSVLLGIGVVFWVMIKLGFGYLGGPLCLVGLGVSRFTGNRGNRKERMAGIALIFGGVVWAVFYTIFLIMER